MTFKDYLMSAAAALSSTKRAGDFVPGSVAALPAWVVANLQPLPPLEMAVYAGQPDIEAMLNPRQAEIDELELDESTLVFGC